MDTYDCSRCGQSSYNPYSQEWCVICDYWRGLSTDEETVEAGVCPWTPFESLLVEARRAVLVVEKFLRRDSAWTTHGWPATLKAQRMLDERREWLYLVRDEVDAYATPRHSRQKVA